MTQVFQTILSMSIGGCVLAALVLIARAIIGRRQTLVLTILFALLIAKLIVPLSIESDASILNILPNAVVQPAMVRESDALDNDAHLVQIQEDDSAQAAGFAEAAGSDDAAASVVANEAPVFDAADMSDTEELNLSAKQDEPMTLWQIGAIVWLCGAAIMTVVIAGSNIAFMRKVNKNRAYTAPGFESMLSGCAKAFGIRQKIRAVQMSDVNTVAVCGILRPKLLISPSAYGALSEQEKRHVIMHELSHIKRKDTLVCLIITIVNVLHWFNPLVWVAFAILRKDLEVMCDTKVLHGMGQGERHSYAQTLVTLASKPGTKNTRLAMALFVSKASIKRRIAMIAKYKKNKPLVVALALVLAVGIAITGCTTSVSELAGQSGDLELLASHTIDYSDYIDDDARVYNIRKAAAMLNGVRIGADEQVALLETIGPITEENGWLDAPGLRWDTVILLLGHEDTSNEMTLEADPQKVQMGGGVGLVATAFCIVGLSASMDQIIDGDFEGLITDGDAGLHNWFDTEVVFETIEDGDTIIVNLYGPGNLEEQRQRMWDGRPSQEPAGIGTTESENQEIIMETVRAYKLGTYKIDFSFCADDKNIVNNIVKTMGILEGKVFNPGMQERLLSKDIYDEDGWETAPAKSWSDIGDLTVENIDNIEYLETQMERGGGSELVLAAVKGAAIKAGLSVTSLDPGEGVLNEFLTDVTLSIILRDNKIFAAFYSQVTPIERTLMASYSYDYQGRYAEESFMNVDKSLNMLGVIELAPGEEISLNEIVGNRVTQGGWGTAEDIVVAHKEFEKGGGVCLVATAIYNAAIRAELEIIEVNHHAILPGDMPDGLDATFSYTGGDLKISNPYDVEIIIQTNFVEGDIISYVYGPEMEYSIDYTIAVIVGDLPDPVYHYNEITVPGGGNRIPDGEAVTYIEGSGITKVLVYKVKYDLQGNEIEKVLFDTVEYELYPAQIYVNEPVSE